MLDLGVPLVSIIMSVHNDEKYLRDAIESILNQSYQNIEVIITNDKSTDSCSKIIEEYSIKDKRIIYIENETNIGLTKSLNNMLDLSNGIFIARMDADDISDINRIKEQVSIFLNDKDVDFVFCDTILIDNTNNEICSLWRPEKLNTILKFMSLTSYIPHPTVMLKKELISNYGKYNEQFRKSQDKELWQRFIRHGVKFHHIKKPLLKYRINLKGITMTSKNRQRENPNYTYAKVCISNNQKQKALKYLVGLPIRDKIDLYFWLLIPFKLFMGLFVIHRYVKLLINKFS